MHKFEAFNIRSIPHLLNSEVDMLANAVSNLCPSNYFSHEKLSVELIYRSSILDNITNWRIFEDDEQIINFLHSEDTFKGLVINDEQNEALLQASSSKDKPEYSNVMPKNIIKMDKLFDLWDKFKKPTNRKINSSSLRYEAINLGTKQNPQNINLGTNCRHAKKEKIMILSK